MGDYQLGRFEIGPKRLDRDDKRTRRLIRLKRDIQVRRLIWTEQGCQCAYCGTRLVFRLATSDHVWPKKRNGFDGLGNLLVSCEPCNKRKGHRLPYPCELLYLWAVNQSLDVPTIVTQPKGIKVTKSTKSEAVAHANALALLGTDAAKWSEAFAKRLGELGNDALDFEPGGDLFAWCANMIEAGRTAGYAEGEKAGELKASRELVWTGDGIDILRAERVEFKQDQTGKVWLNVDDKLVFRAGFIGAVSINLNRE